MAWRIHLSNQSIQNLCFLSSKPASLAVWTRRDKVEFYEAETGALLGERLLGELPKNARTSEEWLNAVGNLVSMDERYYLPYARLRNLDMFSTDDGKLRVYHSPDERLFMETEGEEEELRLIGGERLLAMDLDGALGVFVGLDEQLRLHIYQQNIRVGAFDIGLKRQDDLRPHLSISRGGDTIFASDGKRIVVADTGGNRKKKLDAHYFIGQMAISPTGGMLLTSDSESGVLRAYKGDSLVLTHQKFAIDLLADAAQVQLMADLPPHNTAVSTIAAGNKGMLGFSMSGVVCVSDVSLMDEVPRPRTLL